jgi:arylformamidase
MKFFDVSELISEDMLVYPGNPKPSIKINTLVSKNSSAKSIITIGSHTGTHVDSCMHIEKSGEGVDTLPLENFYGPCKVIDLTYIENEIHREDLEKFSIKDKDIVLIKTKNSQVLNKEFKKDYVHIKPDAAEYLVRIGIRTLGFDYLSVKKFGEDKIVHKILIQNLTLFEGLNLSKVPSGEYTFIGLPLKIKSDGAPARIILVKN